ncbi:two-component system, NtrC family, response regulator HydG [Paenimyroides aquimaris]|uniref:Two-component system, NtrC family, response regulator HydG n=1 Tax=Paenimyroides marinum TaxID=1159016 RepID=A0A1H6MB30_9FLAO|nr:sigma-54 dependent transcriptional regulator [Paenimyroides aquimaris]SEH96138.1 two-component system, NtrC family, response regulator HydG [Paenimyroides aquimaris]
MKKILIIEDDVSFCLMIKTFLTKKGFEVYKAFSFKEAAAILNEEKIDLVLTDVRLPDSDGIEILKFIKDINPAIQVILMTGYTDIKTAVNVMKMGAFDYVAKPINSDEIVHTINKALAEGGKTSTVVNYKKETEKKESSSEINEASKEEFITGKSEKSKELNNFISVVAPTNISVLIIGDSGTGKENIAYSIHKLSKRANMPYIAVDCGAIPKDLAASEFFGHVKGSFTGATTDKIGHFEAANGGTIFLDEVGNLTYDVQVQLLRALQERKVKPVGSSKEIDVDIRIIAATNEDLQKAVREGEFREDLYHRLNEFSIQAPRLNERGKDILEFARFFIAQSNEELERNVQGLSDEVTEVFLSYEWPGNLREMRNIIKRAVLLTQTDLIEKNVLPAEIFQQNVLKNNDTVNGSQNAFSNDVFQLEDLKLYSSKNEEQLIRIALEKAKYNKTKAAQILGIDRKTLYNKLKNYDIEL